MGGLIGLGSGGLLKENASMLCRCRSLGLGSSGFSAGLRQGYSTGTLKILKGALTREPLQGNPLKEALRSFRVWGLGPGLGISALMALGRKSWHFRRPLSCRFRV